jgi:hypothetical protein
VARRPKPPVFVARATYRQRRLRDALRLVPVLGAVLWLVPLLWTRARDAGAVSPMSNATALIYVFGVWFVLIGLAWGLSRFVRDDGPDAAPEDAD